jgi:hypothetical protein
VKGGLYDRFSQTVDKPSANIDINHIKDDFEQAMDAYKKSFDNNIDDNEYNSH